MKSLVPYLYVILFIIVGVHQASSQCKISADFNDFTVNGMSTTIQWQSQAENSVICHSSDWQPSFFVNQDSLLNVKITGEVYMGYNHGDDDFLGFVFGYKSPTISTESNDNRFYLFDWKKVSQHAPDEFGGFLAREGFCLISADGMIPGDPVDTYKHFWGHEEGDNFEVLAENYGNNNGWDYNTTYVFELVYTYNNIVISIDGEEIFNIEGCFHPGLFGLYTLNQNGVVFQNVNIEQMYDIQFMTEEQAYCEELPINFSFTDTACADVPPSLQYYEWYFGDDSIPVNEPSPVHSFYDPGSYDVKLRLTNIEDCVDTISRIIFIEPKPQVIEHPIDQVCYVGDRVDFSIDAEYAESYQWYYQTTDMAYWSKVPNNGYFSGAKTPYLSVYNVRPNFDQMKLRCQLNGVCFNLVTSHYAEIHITENPVRAYINSTEDQICSNDSTILTVRLSEPYQIDRANIRLLFDSTAFEFKDYTTYLQNMIFDFNSGSNFVDINIEVQNPVNINEVIIASLNFSCIGNETSIPEFTFDEENTYFINENQDTILHYLYGTDIHLYQVYGAELNDSIRMCTGEQISLNPNHFTYIEWSTGETSSSIVPQNEGLFAVYLEDIHQCQSIDTFYIQLDEQPIAPASIDFGQDYYCSFDDNISVLVSGGKGNFLKISYQLSEIFDSIPDSLQYTIPNPGATFEVKASWINICGESDELFQTIDVYEEAEPGIQLYSNQIDYELGDMVSIVAEIQDGGEQPELQWYVDNTLVLVGSENRYSINDFFKTQKIEVVMYSDEKCILNASSVHDQIQISLRADSEFYIPSVVTPNGDGIGDCFRVFFKNREVDYFKLSIFDLRGRLVFSSNDMDFSWDGENTLGSGGMEVLTYIIKYKYSNSLEKSLSGKFLLKK